MTTIVQAAISDELEDARRLMRALASWRHERHDGDAALSDPELKVREFEDELNELPGRYAPPQGRLLIAYEDDQPAGCAALRDLGHGTCEIARIFVTGRFRGQRVGRALVERLLLEARGAGYRRMRLDIRMHEDEAKTLCERTGFSQISLDDPGAEDRTGRHAVFERDLRSTA